jgi:hypothetical protein
MSEDQTYADIWEALEDAHGHEAHAPVASLYSWSTNYDPGRGPFTLFLDMLGWSQEQLGQPLYDLAEPSLGYVELSKLADALKAYADDPGTVRAFVDVLMALEAGE